MSPQKIYVDGDLFDHQQLDLTNTVHHRLLQSAILASDATTDEKAGTFIGDPTEVALIMVGDGLGIDEGEYRSRYPRLCELAFDSDRKLMSTLNDVDGQCILSVSYTHLKRAEEW